MDKLDKELILFIEKNKCFDTIEIMKLLEKRVMKLTKKLGWTLVKNIKEIR